MVSKAHDRGSGDCPVFLIDVFFIPASRNSFPVLDSKTLSSLKEISKQMERPVGWIIKKAVEYLVEKAKSGATDATLGKTRLGCWSAGVCRRGRIRPQPRTVTRYELESSFSRHQSRVCNC